jgi:hypothetical protein
MGLKWNIEATLQELRAHLGVETQRQWSEDLLSGIFQLPAAVAVKNGANDGSLLFGLRRPIMMPK